MDKREDLEKQVNEILNDEKSKLIGDLCYYNMGTAYVKCKDYKNAIEFLNKALVIRVRENGENDPDVALVMGHIGGIYYEQGNYEKAIETFSKAYDILKRTCSRRQPCVPHSLRTMWQKR